MSLLLLNSTGQSNPRIKGQGIETPDGKGCEITEQRVSIDMGGGAESGGHFCNISLDVYGEQVWEEIWVEWDSWVERTVCAKAP